MPILTPEERIGSTVSGKYRLESIIGKGGMGVVYQAIHELTGRPVAVKILMTGMGVDAELAGRFLQEARAAARLDHPNVVDVLDMGEDDDTPYMVLELLTGETLADLVRRERQLAPQDCLDIMLPVMDALGEAHANGIVHRDIKPSNIFLSDTRNGVVPKLLDFGIAKVHDEESAWKTTTGGLLGTPAYMSPEQVRATTGITAATDVWSIGVVFFRCLAGELPFNSANPGAIFSLILTTRPPDLLDVAPHVPPPIAHVVNIALAEDPEDRHADMAEFAEQLRIAAQASGTRAKARVVGHGLRESSTLRVGKGGYVAAAPPGVGALASGAATAPGGSSEATIGPLTAPDSMSSALVTEAAMRVMPEAGGPPISEQTTAPPGNLGVAPTVRLETDDAAPAGMSSGPAAGTSHAVGTNRPTEEALTPSASTPIVNRAPARGPEPKRGVSGIVIGVVAALLSAGLGFVLYASFGGAPESGPGGNGEVVSNAGEGGGLVGAEATGPTDTNSTGAEGAPVGSVGADAGSPPSAAPSGTLVVQSALPCDLTVDGREVTGADEGIFIAAGRHELVCVRDGETRRAEVDIAPSQETNYTFEFPSSARKNRGRGRPRMTGMHEVTNTMESSPLDIGRDYQ